MDAAQRSTRFLRGLSSRLLVLTVVFVMVAEVLIFVPSIARFRISFLEQRVYMAHLVSLSLKATPSQPIEAALEVELLRNAGVRAIVLKRQEARSLMLSEDMPPNVDMVYDLRTFSVVGSIAEALRTLFFFRDRVLRVIDDVPDATAGSIEILMDEAPLYQAMARYATNILQLSIVISLISACLVFLALHILIARPMRRLVDAIAAFRVAPEDGQGTLDAPSRRSDEIGVAERELARMQEEVRGALRQKSRLAALGTAVSKINHDLRNILATAQLVSDRLKDSDDPAVRRVAPRLIGSIDRAIQLCTETLTYGQAKERPPRRATLPLAEMVQEAALTAGVGGEAGIALENLVPRGFTLEADRDQVFRILLNLLRNAAEAMEGHGTVRVSAGREARMAWLEVADDGPGLPGKARERLFQPFAGSARAGGTGLGLAIAHDLARAHDGELTLVESGPGGTVFRLAIPDPPVAGRTAAE